MLKYNRLTFYAMRLAYPFGIVNTLLKNFKNSFLCFITGHEARDLAGKLAENGGFTGKDMVSLDERGKFDYSSTEKNV